MNPNQALQILINAVKQANQKGAFTLEESEIISVAVKTFQKQAPEAKGPNQAEQTDKKTVPPAPKKPFKGKK